MLQDAGGTQYARWHLVPRTTAPTVARSPGPGRQDTTSSADEVGACNLAGEFQDDMPEYAIRNAVLPVTVPLSLRNVHYTCNIMCCSSGY